jgi:nucleotide-binding universal stress UspA family protein
MVMSSGRVVVGVSGSPGSIRALRYAADLARFRGAPLVTVLAWVPPGGEIAEHRAPSAYLREIWRRGAAKRLMDALEAAWGGVPLDLHVHHVVARGEAGQVLVDVADGADDVLVIGAGRRGAVARLWHGKVSRYCLGHASCPVLAVPESPLARHVGSLRRWSFRRSALNADRLGRVGSAASLDDHQQEGGRG